MGTVCTISAAPTAKESDFNAAFDEIARVEEMLSTWRDSSQLSQLNRAPVGAATAVSPELREILIRVLQAAHESGSAFNPLVRPLIDAWDTRGEGQVPTADAIAHALTLMRIDDLSLDRQSGKIIRRADVRIEEGAFGKGYALDGAVVQLRRRGVRDATLDFGGQLFAIGAPIRVAIASPDDRQSPALTLELRDVSLSTSSGSEKRFEIEGRSFTHLFDPRSGEALPPRGSVSVIAPNACDADIASTTLYVLGPEDGITYANEHDIAAIFLTPAAKSGEFEVRLSNAARPQRTGLRITDPHFKLKD